MKPNIEKMTVKEYNEYLRKQLKEEAQPSQEDYDVHICSLEEFFGGDDSEYEGLVRNDILEQSRAMFEEVRDEKKNK